VAKKEKYLVCAALPYANGPLHVGHLAGCYVPSDVFARFQRLCGHDVHFVCGSDEHGAPIMIRAAQEGVSPQSIVDKYHKLLKTEFEQLNISFDIFSRTTHKCHAERTKDIFLNLNKAGLITTKVEQRLYCPKDKQFLPDRYVVGTCPNCGSPGARGDQCEKCGSWYEPEALIDPICQICKTERATFKETTHWYLLLDKLEPKIRAWLETKAWWRKSVLGYAFQPLKAELVPRAITRDLDWGIPVPLPEAKDKVFYVWFDAPIGYISASEDLSIRNGKPDAWRDYWEDPNTKLIHFIGKDNIIFHTVVWPAVLMGDGRYVLPYLVAGNEFLNLEGEKISTSRNFAIWVGEVLKEIEADYLRYYLTRISPETSDSNFTWNDYQNRINSELADVIGNLVNRALTFVRSNFEGKIQTVQSELQTKVEAASRQAFEKYGDHLKGGFSKLASDALLDLGRELNGIFQEAAPWKTKKESAQKAKDQVSAICFGIRTAAILLYPICPALGQKIWLELGYQGRIEDQALEELYKPFSGGHIVGASEGALVKKVEDSFVEAQKAKLVPIK
jgi:methionyl-tRNA synthetase